MSMTLSPMAGMGSNGSGIGSGASLPLPLLLQMMQANNSPPSAGMSTPMSNMMQHQPPMAGATPGPAMMPSQPPQQQNGMSAMMPAIMQMLAHGGSSNPGTGIGPGLLNFLTGSQAGVVPQGVPGGMPTSAPATTASTGGVGGFLTLPGILRSLNPNYAGPMPPSGGAF